VAGRGEVDDGEPSVPEADVAGSKQSLVVRPAVRDQTVHPTNDGSIDGLAAQEVDASDYAAHVVSPASFSKRW
jgi:hypothetical protein